MEDKLKIKFKKMEDDLKKNKNGRRPNFFLNQNDALKKMEDDLKKQTKNMEDDPKKKI